MQKWGRGRNHRRLRPPHSNRPSRTSSPPVSVAMGPGQHAHHAVAATPVA
jgi:hypothetical protein